MGVEVVAAAIICGDCMNVFGAEKVILALPLLLLLVMGIGATIMLLLLGEPAVIGVVVATFVADSVLCNNNGEAGRTPAVATVVVVACSWSSKGGVAVVIVEGKGIAC